MLHTFEASEMVRRIKTVFETWYREKDTIKINLTYDE
jgi:hypothetical protein